MVATGGGVVARTRRAGGEAGLLMAIFFASGFAALVYQVLWVRELGLLFGSTAEAVAMAIAIFFAGIASGGWYWGRRAARVRNALVGFAGLELAVAATALGHFLLIDVYHAIYPAIYQLIGHDRALETVAKAAVAAVILLPPSFLMGGTLPMMGQYLVRRREELGTTGSALYAINTFGGAAGALAAGFVLPMALGLTGAYLLAVATDMLVGLAAFLLALRRGATPAAVAQEGGFPAAPAMATTGPAMPRRLVWIVAFASGFVTLGIEVIWTRLFSQVLQNSAYTYSLVLTTFLAALALGAWTANALARTAVAPARMVSLLLASSAVVAAASPWLFHGLTDGLGYVGARHGWWGYVAAVAALALPVMLVPAIILGAVLPYLLRALAQESDAPGELIGRLVAANTAGAILGSIAAAFLLLPVFGATASLTVLAAVYAVLSGVSASTFLRRARLVPPAAGAAIAVAALALMPDGPAQVRLDPARGERLIELREGTAAHVAVVQRERGRVLRVNNYYTLGGTATLDPERNQAIIPMLTHPEPRSVFFLGMGTGLTAGASLYFPVERVTVCEIVPDVIELARLHFEPWVNGLFDDPRVRMHAEDGRNCLRRSPDRYDVIVSDLFTPWKAGTGNLYTVEHFRTVHDRLEAGGVFAQWIPLYQVSERELGIIARTMQEVFSEVVVWRGDLYAERSIVALVGRRGDSPLDPPTLVANARAMTGMSDIPEAFLLELVLRFYAGNLSASGLFEESPVNTDNHPIIEYLAPRTHRAVIAGEARWVTGPARDAFYRALLAAAPPEDDPYLVRLTPVQRDYVRAGLRQSQFARLNRREREAADRHRSAVLRKSPLIGVRPLSPAGRLVAARQTE